MADNINQTLEDLQQTIDDLTQKLDACCTSKGQEIDAPPSDGEISVGEGEQFPTSEAYFNAKCSAANAIFDTVKGKVNWLKTNNVDMLAGAFGGITTALALGLLVAGPVGWTIQLVGVTIVSLATFLISNAVNFEDLEDALADVHDEIVIGMYNSSNTTTAKAVFVAAVENSSVSTTAIDIQLLRILLVAAMMNQLFSPRGDTAVYVSPDPVDCGGAVLEVWSFEAGLESWTFVDASDPGSSATRSYDSVEEAIENEYIVESAPFVSAFGINTSPFVSHALTPGASVQVDYSAPSDAPKNHGINVIAEYSDATEEETGILTFNTAGTIILTITVTKTINNVRVECGRSTSGSADGTTSQQDFLEVRIVGI